MARKWNQPEVGRYDKRMFIDGPLPLIIDYDDVPTGDVDLLAEAVVVTLNAHFVAPVGMHCEGDEGCQSYWETKSYPGGIGHTCLDCGGSMSDPYEVSL